jgi:hypothetical protein
MKKLHFFSSTFFPLLILWSVGFSQTPTWISKYDNGNARAMTIDGAGNIYVTGPSDGGKKTGTDFLTVKYNPTGGLVWAARYNYSVANGEDWPYAIDVDGSGNVYVTGRSVTSSSGKGPNYDYATVKYNSSGAQVWASRYGSSGNRSDFSQDVKVDANGYVYVTGFTDAIGLGGPGNSITTIKYDPVLGTELRRMVYDVLPNIYDSPNPNAEQAFSLAVDAPGNVYVAGTVLIKYNSSGTIVWVNSSVDDRREVLVDGSNNILTTGFSGKTTKYDALGNLLWQATSANGFWDMALDVSGNVYVTGNGNSTYETVKYDGNIGTQVWAATYLGNVNNADFARSIAVDNLGNAYVTGHTTVPSGRTDVGNIGTIKYNNIGHQEWLSLYEGDGFGIAADAEDNIYVAGTGAGTRTTSSSILLLKYAANSPASKYATATPITETKQPKFTLQNFPNPFTQSTTIEYQTLQEGKVKLSIYDLQGKQIAALINKNQPAGIYRINFSADKLPAGTYIYKIQAGEFIETKKMIVMK